mgnify:FL=1|jgi:DNA-binding IscR family transcriptional regulator
MYDSVIMINFEDRNKTKLLRDLVKARNNNTYRSVGNLATTIGIPESSVRGRLSEMRQKGLVQSVSEATGGLACFKITEAGIEHLERYTEKIEV